MTAGLLVLLAVLTLAVLLAPPLIRPRMLARRRRLEAPRAPGWYMLRDELGLHVGTSPFIDPHTMIVGEVPPMRLEEGPLVCSPLADDLNGDRWRWQLAQEFRLAAVVNDATPRPFLITGI